MQKCKNIWIIRTLADSPLQKNQRPERATRLASYLSKQGYKVTYWGTTFNHFEKEHLYNKTVHEKINENENVILLHIKKAYKKNISIQRFIYGCRIAQKLGKEMQKEICNSKPDLIFVSYPTEESCRVAEKFGRKNGVPVIVDARDMWPDIFERAFPNFIKFLVPWIIAPLKMRAAKVFRNAAALCAVSPVMLSWALSYAQREKSSLDRTIFIGNEKYLIDSDIQESNLKEFEKIGVTSDTWNICLFSTLSAKGLDSDSLIEAIQMVHEKYPSVRLIIGGTGDDESRLRKKVSDKPYIKLMGWMNQEQMASVMSISKIGIVPYHNTFDLKNAWGNKFGQYFSYGLPILNSTIGIAKEYLEKFNCGITYKENDCEGLAAIIIELINNKENMKRLSENARQRFFVDFDEQILMEKFEEMILDTYYNEKHENKGL